MKCIEISIDVCQKMAKGNHSRMNPRLDAVTLTDGNGKKLYPIPEFPGKFDVLLTNA